LHLGPRAFDSIGGEVVQTVAFIFLRAPSSNSAAIFVRLVGGGNESEKVALLNTAVADVRNPLRFKTHPLSFTALPDNVFGYWLSERARTAFKNGKPLASVGKPRQGLATTNNALFLRFWYEVSLANLKFDCADMIECSESKA